ncbi:MAG: DUF3226 domain-containing protein [Cyanobacteriota bacterium]
MLKIFVEGKGDESFIYAYIKHLFGKDKADFIKPNIIKTGGWTKIDLIVQQFIETIDSNGKNLIIFDSDSVSNNGGFTKRKNELEQKKEFLSIDFELFLFPNNKDDGDYEFLLENIINQNHSVIFQCFNNYETCLKAHKDDEGKNIYNLPIRKSKIFAYIDAFNFSRKQKEEIKKGNLLFDDSAYWDLNCQYLIDLKKFLEKYI